VGAGNGFLKMLFERFHSSGFVNKQRKDAAFHVLQEITQATHEVIEYTKNGDGLSIDTYAWNRNCTAKRNGSADGRHGWVGAAECWHDVWQALDIHSVDTDILSRSHMVNSKCSFGFFPTPFNSSMPSLLLPVHVRARPL
jgi:hypothetical protein